MKRDIALALDLGGSKYVVGLVDTAGKVLCHRRGEWQTLTGEGVAAEIVEAGRALLADYPQHQPIVVGATIPGVADPVRGLWVESSFSGIRGLPMGQLLADAFGLPAFIDNDTRACALAERRFGCCRETDHFLWVTVSNGIGGAVFAGGSLFYGGLYGAGEVGHIVVEEGPAARTCLCGNRGCAEIMASGRAIPHNYRALGGQKQINGETPTAKSIDWLARAGDAVAQEAYRMEGVYLGRAIAAAVNVVNPQKVVIGGGVSLGFDLFAKPLWETLATHVYNGANPNLQVEATPLGYHAALLGAAALAFGGTGTQQQVGRAVL